MNRYRTAVVTIGLGLLFFATYTAEAEVKLPAILSDNMVLQQGQPITIWGWADPGETVKVSVKHRSASTVAAPDKRWRVRIEPLPPGGPLTLTVSGKNTLTLSNIMVGEVWFCSGQSNMAVSVAKARDYLKEAAKADYPAIRMFTVKKRSAKRPLSDCSGDWVVCTPETVVKFSGTAYFFGRELHQQLKVPIGLVVSAFGGTAAQSWTPAESVKADPKLRPYIDDWATTIEMYNADMKQYRKNLVRWEEEQKMNPAAGTSATSKPAVPAKPWDSRLPGSLFNGMVLPFVELSIRGVIWYQGEANAYDAEGRYQALFSRMIGDWRKAWGRDDLPFLFVQIPNHEPKGGPSENAAWALLREAQLKVLALPNTGMAVMIDDGEPKLSHPHDKQTVGSRLAVNALGTVYGKSITPSGPLYTGMAIEGSKIRIRFKYTGGGLVAKGANGELKGFALAGKDRKWFPAQAQTDGDTVLVWSAAVPAPVAVRYGWADNPTCTLYNDAGLPASPFRSDDW